MNTLFDKIWDAHVVQKVEDGPTQLYIDRLYCHEVTSPQAFDELRNRGIGCLRPDRIYCMPDHNIPTMGQENPIEEPVSRKQVETLVKNAEQFGLSLFGMKHPKNGIIHVVGPELAFPLSLKQKVLVTSPYCLLRYHILGSYTLEEKSSQIHAGSSTRTPIST